MVLRLSTLFLRTLREDPADAEVRSHKLLVRAGYIRRAAPGIYTWLPMGLRVLNKIEAIVREEMAAIGSQEVHFPALLPREPYEATGRWSEYGDNIFRLKDRKDADYLLAPTHEEMFTLLVKDLFSSYKDLPVNLYQIQTKYRDEPRPRAGLMRGREFIMKDSYSFDVDDAGLDQSYKAQREAYFKIFDRLGLEIVAVQATSGAMGGSKSEEFLHPSAAGEDTYVRSANGYAANVEAVSTPIPASIDYSNAAAIEVKETPGTATIATLVEAANAVSSKADGSAYTAADTLKNVVLAVTGPDEESGEIVRKLVAIGLPGDREIDLKRVEANIGTLVGIAGEPEIEPATEADFAKNPLLVRGYIGPGLDREHPVLGREAASKVTYLLDPRVVPGTSWITGANEAGKHVFGLVAERDFVADAVIDAGQVRDGDVAPDGSGTLEIARGIEMGHVFQLGRKYAEKLGLKVLDQNGKQVTVTMGSYGIGVTRAMAAIAEKYSDDKGLVWPKAVAPVHVHILPVGKGEELLAAATSLADDLQAAGLEVLLDDRPKLSPGVRFSDAELIGAPVVLAVGRGLAEGTVELKNRATGEGSEVPVSNTVSAVRELLDTLS